MKIKTRKIEEVLEKFVDEDDGKVYTFKRTYENGFVEENEIQLNDISAFSNNKSIRLIGIGKNLYLLTLKSWKEVKKELVKSGLMQRFDLSKAN